jgi:hypothetical protein
LYGLDERALRLLEEDWFACEFAQRAKLEDQRPVSAGLLIGLLTLPVFRLT